MTAQHSPQKNVLSFVGLRKYETLNVASPDKLTFDLLMIHLAKMDGYKVDEVKVEFAEAPFPKKPKLKISFPGLTNPVLLDKLEETFTMHFSPQPLEYDVDFNPPG